MNLSSHLFILLNLHWLSTWGLMASINSRKILSHYSPFMLSHFRNLIRFILELPWHFNSLLSLLSLHTGFQIITSDIPAFSLVYTKDFPICNIINPLNFWFYYNLYFKKTYWFFCLQPPPLVISNSFCCCCFCSLCFIYPLILYVGYIIFILCLSHI